MKIHHVAILLLVIIALFVGINAWYITSTVDEYLATWQTLEAPEHVSGLLTDVRRLREDYTRFEEYVSLTISHEDLMNLRTALADLEGAAEGDDRAAFLQAKSRLVDALVHLRRLSGFTTYSIV
ncbi:MAG: DUF4363 family protein [Clostridia bacterium]|nr:DUF4363 family protein [Clostridia bacterium]